MTLLDLIAEPLIAHNIFAIAMASMPDTTLVALNASKAVRTAIITSVLRVRCEAQTALLVECIRSRTIRTQLLVMGWAACTSHAREHQALSLPADTDTAALGYERFNLRDWAKVTHLHREGTAMTPQPTEPLHLASVRVLGALMRYPNKLRELCVAATAANAAERATLQAIVTDLMAKLLHQTVDFKRHSSLKTGTEANPFVVALECLRYSALYFGGLNLVNITDVSELRKRMSLLYDPSLGVSSALEQVALRWHPDAPLGSCHPAQARWDPTLALREPQPTVASCAVL